MAKLYFKYGAMGSSKSAQALITQFNYEELGMTVWLIKPSVDDRDGANIIRSRIGLQREAQVIHPDEDIIATFARAGHADVIIADEAQFFSPEQILHHDQQCAALGAALRRRQARVSPDDQQPRTGADGQDTAGAAVHLPSASFCARILSTQHLWHMAT